VASEWFQRKNKIIAAVQHLLVRSHKRFTEEQKTKVFRSIVKEARVVATGVELEMYVQPTQNVWWKYRQKQSAPAHSTKAAAQSIRISLPVLPRARAAGSR